MKRLLLAFSLLWFVQCSFLDSASGSVSRSVGSVSDSTGTILGSLSKSVSSLSTSSSGGGEKANTAYQEDIRALFGLYASSRTLPSDWEQGMAFVAREHGIASWKNHPSTYIGIGKGAREAGLRSEDLQTLLSPSSPFASYVWQGFLEHP